MFLEQMRPGRARCDLVLLGWTIFITLNLASDYFWSRNQEALEGFRKSKSLGGGCGEGRHDGIG